MAEQLEATAALTNRKVQFTVSSGTNPPVTMDYKAPLGDGQGYTGLELLLMSLAGCSGTAITFLLRKMGKSVDGLKVSATGTRRETHPTSFQNISLQFILTSRDASEPDLRKAIQLAEESICPVWAMLKGNVQVAAECKILAPCGD